MDQWEEMYYRNSTPNASYVGPPDNQVMWHVNVDYNYEALKKPAEGDYGQKIRFKVFYKSTFGLTGTIITEDCLFREAIVRYPVTMTNNTLRLIPMAPGENMTIAKVVRASESGGLGILPSTNGGLYLALQNVFNSTADVSISPPYYRITTASSAARNYLARDSSPGSENISWVSPTQDAYDMLRELSFRAAIATTLQSPSSALYQIDESSSRQEMTAFQSTIYQPNLTHTNRSIEQTVPVIRSSSMTVYHSHYGFLAGGISVIFLAAFAIIPIFLGWWHLGRPVSMSPLEIARAFEAPLLVSGSSTGTDRTSDSIAHIHNPSLHALSPAGTSIMTADPNSTAKEIVSAIGSKRVIYRVTDEQGVARPRMEPYKLHTHNFGPGPGAAEELLEVRPKGFAKAVTSRESMGELGSGTGSISSMNDNYRSYDDERRI